MLLTAAFGAWAWVVKKAADKHLESVSRIENKVDSLTIRVNTLETKMEIFCNGYSEHDR